MTKKNTEHDMNIEEIIDQIKQRTLHYDVPDDINGFEQIFDYLSNKKEKIGVEYSFLCWLNYRFNWKININSPKTPITVEDCTLIDFKHNFLFNSDRRFLFSRFEQFSMKNNLMENSILIGGSFIDIIDIPSDLDAIFLVSDHLLTYEAMNEYNSFPEKLDVYYLPQDYSLDKFRAYYHLTAFGNKATKKEKDNKRCIENNEFEKRKIIRIKI